MVTKRGKTHSSSEMPGRKVSSFLKSKGADCSALVSVKAAVADWGQMRTYDLQLPDLLGLAPGTAGMTTGMFDPGDVHLDGETERHGGRRRGVEGVVRLNRSYGTAAGAGPGMGTSLTEDAGGG